MAYNKTPTNTWPGYTSNGTSITIPLAALPGLSSGAADATTGDAREILQKIIDSGYAKIQSLASADKPAKMRVSNSVSVDSATNAETLAYSAVFEGTAGTFALGSET